MGHSSSRTAPDDNPPALRPAVAHRGRAAIVDDAGLLAPSAVEGRAPKLGVVVSIEEAFTHCPKALIRSDLWNPEGHVNRSELPSSGAILRSIADDELDVGTYDQEPGERYARRENLY